MAALKERLSFLATPPLPPNASGRHPDEELYEEDIWGENGATPSISKSGFEPARESENRCATDLESRFSSGLFLGGRKRWGVPPMEPKLRTEYKLQPYSLSSMSPSSTLSFLDSVSPSGPTPTTSRPISIAANPTRVHASTMRQSAPVTIPDWSKMRAKGNQHAAVRQKNYLVEEEIEEDTQSDLDAESGMIPPHELLSREYSKQISFSVYEGAGRTLKGRDLNGFRSSVLRKTGFLE